MKTLYKTGLAMLAIFLLAAGCSKSPSRPDYQREVTVFGYLWGNQPLDSTHAILVAETRPLLDFYDLGEAAIRNAAVTITETGTGKLFTLTESPFKPGFYYNDSLHIKPKETYSLQVITEGRTITASTTVPPELLITTDLKSGSVNSVYPAGVSRRLPVFLQGENPDQIVMVDMYCNETWENAEYISTFFGQDRPNDQEEYDGGRDGEPRHIMGIARMREMVSDDFPGTYVVDWYSSMLVFYGSYTMQVLAIDKNGQDYIFKEHPEYSGGISGGIGVFASACGEAFRLQVLKP